MSNGAVALRAPSDDEIGALERIRREGHVALTYQKEVNKIAEQMKAAEWGGNMRQGTRMMIAEICRVTGANPLTHIDVLGGKPYFNAEFFSDKITADPYFIRYEQRDLSPSVEHALRDRAKRHGEMAQKLEEAGEAGQATKRRAMALDLDEEADDIALARSRWSPRPTATAVIETTIFRFINAAPLDAIKSGEVTDIDRYIVPVVECNWAGGMGNTMKDAKKWDPIGDANPGTTARSRSLRRAAKKAFSTWMAPYEEQIRKVEEVVYADFTVVEDDEREARQLASGPQAVSTAGEPEATSTVGAHDLPVRGEEQPTRLPYNEPEETEAPDQGWDRTDTHRRFFATLKDAGIVDSERKTWAKDHGLPPSTKLWTYDHYEQALEILVGPVREEAHALLGDRDLEDASLQSIGKSQPDYLSDWQKLVLFLENEDAEEQPEMDL